ncbi:endolysin [Acinetobacter phage YMC11/12/R2315]|uniref:Lysozyme n=3 Tax=Obolenskvirus AbC62 TaxID=1915206 RepID=A0A0D4DC08_9CAUD|nr:endolysin [Acinetobacter phage YMC-13-01-C62]YP_009203599.1 endolysin [Acinetobacter phage YMC11/12/R2315]AJT61420.1 putative endolysin/autolysin [Acinetobacter phage YMC11/12/R1215]WNT46055.1 lysozyme R [Acinetobacter phage P115]WNT46472.1 lysozyme R [Acinetobacter phage A832.1]AID17956.1 putative endolysin/autolysin [Acinetobacter phage YMC-13-01-C62]AJT61311.1 putative endolysin/autolysin [Acinetobacter phage YMC11/12/R2315]
MSIKNFFDAAREIAGGKLTQAQVDDLNKVIDRLSPSGMTTSDTGINLISTFEGTRLTAYDDGVGVWTIGIGTTVYPNGTKVKKGDTCTSEQAKTYFKHDLIKFENVVNESVKVPLSQNQFDALVSLTYNIGSGAFKNSTLLKLLNNGDYQGAADQFPAWKKAGGRVLEGLVKRRAAERSLFLKK